MDAMEPFSGEPFISADPKTITDFEVSAEIVVRKGPMDDADPLAFEAWAEPTCSSTRSRRQNKGRNQS